MKMLVISTFVLLKIKSFSCEMFCMSIRSKKRPRQNETAKWKVSLHMSQLTHQVGTYSGFCSITRSISTTLLPPFPLRWDASPLQGYMYLTLFASTCLSTGVERGSKSYVSCSRTQYNVPRQGSGPDYSK